MRVPGGPWEATRVGIWRSGRFLGGYPGGYIPTVHASLALSSLSPRKSLLACCTLLDPRSRRAHPLVSFYSPQVGVQGGFARCLSSGSKRGYNEAMTPMQEPREVP